MTRREIVTATVTASAFAGLTVLVAAGPFSVSNDDDEDAADERENGLRKVFRFTRVSLQQGLDLSSDQGQPISARFEVENRSFQLAVFTSKDGRFLQVMIAPSSGKITNAQPITNADTFARLQSQRAAMDTARTSLKEAVEKAVRAAAGFRPAAVAPGLSKSHPVASVFLLRGGRSRTVNVPLD